MKPKTSMFVQTVEGSNPFSRSVSSIASSWWPLYPPQLMSTGCQ